MSQHGVGSESNRHGNVKIDHRISRHGRAHVEGENFLAFMTPLHSRRRWDRDQGGDGNAGDFLERDKRRRCPQGHQPAGGTPRPVVTWPILHVGMHGCTTNNAFLGRNLLGQPRWNTCGPRYVLCTYGENEDSGTQSMLGALPATRP